jgi:hypothetical protein
VAVDKKTLLLLSAGAVTLYLLTRKGGALAGLGQDDGGDGGGDDTFFTTSAGAFGPTAEEPSVPVTLPGEEVNPFAGAEITAPVAPSPIEQGAESGEEPLSAEDIFAALPSPGTIAAGAVSAASALYNPLQYAIDSPSTVAAGFSQAASAVGQVLSQATVDYAINPVINKINNAQAAALTPLVQTTNEISDLMTGYDPATGANANGITSNTTTEGASLPEDNMTAAQYKAYQRANQFVSDFVSAGMAINKSGAASGASDPDLTAQVTSLVQQNWSGSATAGEKYQAAMQLAALINQTNQQVAAMKASLQAAATALVGTPALAASSAPAIQGLGAVTHSQAAQLQAQLAPQIQALNNALAKARALHAGAVAARKARMQQRAAKTPKATAVKKGKKLHGLEGFGVLAEARQ